MRTNEFQGVKALLLPALYDATKIEPLRRLDAWSSSSLLQKAIRRGDTVTAQRAALTFMHFRRHAIWHRFLVIAFEDIGLASTGALRAVAEAATNREWREAAGGDHAAACKLAALLAQSPKDRSPDHAICAGHHHPDLEFLREQIGMSDLHHRLLNAADDSQPFITRVVATWFASGINWGEEKRIEVGDLPSLISRYHALGLPEDILLSTQIAIARTKEPICLMTLPIWHEASRGTSPDTKNTGVPPTQTIDAVPMYTFDKHTRIGKAAIRKFAVENDEVRRCLAEYVPEFRAVDVACIAAFHTDAAPVSLKWHWDGCDELERLGIEADLLSVGLDRAGIAEVLSSFARNLGHLDDIRAKLFGGMARV